MLTKAESTTQENFYFVSPSSKNTPTNDRSNFSSIKSKQFSSYDSSQVKGSLVQLLYKEIDKLKKMNTYLQQQVEQRDELLKKERISRNELKSLFINTKQEPQSHQLSSVVLKQSSKKQDSFLEIPPKESIVSPSTSKKLLFEPDTPKVYKRRSSTYVSTAPSLFMLSPTEKKQSNEVGGIQEPQQPQQTFTSQEDVLKFNIILDLKMSDEDAVKLYENDVNIKFTNQLLGSEDKFIAALQKANQQRISFIYEKLQKLQKEHRILFSLLLRLKTIIKGTIDISNSLILDEALEKIISASINSLGCDRSSCFVADQTKGELWTKVAKGMDTRIRIPINKGVAGHVATYKELVNIHNAYSDKRFNKEVDRLNNYKTKNILASPIMDEGQCLGVLQCINKKEGHFTMEDEALLRILCAFSQTILKHTMNNDQQLLTHSKLRQTIKCGINLQNVVASQSVRQVLLQVEKNIRAIMSTEFVRIIIKSQQEQYYFTEQGEKQSFDCWVGISGTAMKEGHLINMFNPQQHPDYCPLVDINTTLPVLAIPLLQNDITYGCLQVVNVKGFQTHNQLQFPRVAKIDLEVLEHISLQLIEALKYLNI